MNVASLPRTLESQLTIGAGQLEANVLQRSTASSMPTIAATGATEVNLIAPCAGTVSSVKFVTKDALAQHATNFVTFSLTNKGQAGAGSTPILAGTDANTTKTSTGTAVAAYTARTMALNGTPANLVVAAGDVLAFAATAAATSANTMTEAYVQVLITPS